MQKGCGHSLSTSTDDKHFRNLIHPFFMMVRLALDLEPNPGMLFMRWEYTLNGMTVHCRALCTHTFIVSKEQFRVDGAMR